MPEEDRVVCFEPLLSSHFPRPDHVWPLLDVLPCLTPGFNLTASSLIQKDSEHQNSGNQPYSGIDLSKALVLRWSECISEGRPQVEPEQGVWITLGSITISRCSEDTPGEQLCLLWCKGEIGWTCSRQDKPLLKSSSVTC